MLNKKKHHFFTLPVSRNILLRSFIEDGMGVEGPLGTKIVLPVVLCNKNFSELSLLILLSPPTP